MTEIINNNVSNNLIPAEQNVTGRNTGTKPHVGLITPINQKTTAPKLLPDEVKDKLSSNTLNADKFQGNDKKLEVSDKVETPIGVKIIFGLVALGACILGVKKFASKFLGLFKRN